jgi:hypothetical protein
MMSNKPKAITEDDFEKSTMTAEEIEEDIAIYEKMHGFSSEKLLEMEAEGTLPDTFEIHAWRILLKYRR